MSSRQMSTARVIGKQIVEDGGHQRPEHSDSQISYPSCMDHLTVLREKIGRLRSEIAEIQRMNEQHRREYGNEADAQVANSQRLERLEAIQQELAQLAALGRKVRSVEEMKEKHRSRIHLAKKAS
jgi:hypothetical protein